MTETRKEVGPEVSESRARVLNSIESLRADIRQEFGTGPGPVWFLPLAAAAVGLVAALALRRSLRRADSNEID
jgi:hypothetical protein